FWGALGAVLLALNLRLLTDRFFGGLASSWARRLLLLGPALALAFSRTYWAESISTKGGIYILESLLLMALFLSLLRSESGPPARFDRGTAAAFFLAGLGLSHHWQTQLIFLPGLFLFVLVRGGGRLPPAKAWFQNLAWTALGLSVLGLYLPLRANLQPVLDLGDPQTLFLFKMAVTRGYVQGEEPSLLAALARALTGAGPWEPVRRIWDAMMENQLTGIVPHFWGDLKPTLLALAGFGVWAWARRGAKAALVFLLCGLGCLLSVFYTGLLVPTVAGRWTLDNYLLPSNWITALLGGLGLLALWGPLGKARAGAGALKAAWCLLAAALPLWPLLSNFPPNDESRQMLRYDYGVNLMKSTPRGAILFSEGDEDFFPLYYLQLVEHRRPDLCVIPPFTLFETWGVAELERFHPELGLTAAGKDFPDHFRRIEYALPEIVDKNRSKRVIAFTYLSGAFHRYYCQPLGVKKAESSGILLWLDGPLNRRFKPLPREGLRLRHWWDSPSNAHPSLRRVLWAYLQMGVRPPGAPLQPPSGRP
ncbi:MAG TPA: DUF2723 domain-containing protein, partial [bacterium]|nr:DUF2723 domain-containing protein [bacterium]